MSGVTGDATTAGAACRWGCWVTSDCEKACEKACVKRSTLWFNWYGDQMGATGEIAQCAWVENHDRSADELNGEFSLYISMFTNVYSLVSFGSALF